MLCFTILESFSFLLSLASNYFQPIMKLQHFWLYEPFFTTEYKTR